MEDKPFPLYEAENPENPPSLTPQSRKSLALAHQRLHRCAKAKVLELDALAHLCSLWSIAFNPKNIDY